MQGWVAIILALCVLVFFIAGSVLPYLVKMYNVEYTSNVEVAALWADVIKVLVGGLIGYAAGNNNNRS